MTDIPEGWTDDMNIPLPEGVTAAKIAEFVLSSAAAGESHDARIEKLRSWGLTPDDAELACYRALGGAFRAGTTSPANEPSAEKDPIAHSSYHRCRADRALISAIFPREFVGGLRPIGGSAFLVEVLAVAAPSESQRRDQRLAVPFNC